MSKLRALFPAVIPAVLFLVICAPRGALAEGPKVAVFPIRNNGQSQYNAMAAGLSSIVTNNLNKSDKLEVLEPQTVLAALVRVRMTGGAPSVDDALKVAAGLGADYAVTGTFLMFGGKFRIDVRVYDVHTGAVKLVDKAQAGEQEFFDKVDELSDRIIIGIAGSLPIPKGTLTIDSVPEGASITLDGSDAGETPSVVKDIEAGQHKVDIELYGYKPYSETVNVAEGEGAIVKAVLVPMNGGIRVWWSEEPSSDVQIGKDIIRASTFRYSLAQAPSKYCRNLPAGTYTVSVRMPYKDESSWNTARQWKTYTADVDITPGEVTDVFISNKLFSPSLDVSVCGSCADNWDFNTNIIWYETAY